VGISSLVFVVGADQLLAAVSPLETMVVLYVGPEQILPMASAIGAAVGVLLIAWHRAAALCHRLWRFCTKRAATTASEHGPGKGVSAADARLPRGEKGPIG
jgi:hypothetical protein